ncbi:ATP-dependent RNA helicase HrpA [Tomitella gaofuii]|uniref:ATP-dependent RNA helicase HrpA n=2 Tax=Tomitella gaofuii TaxID=2760083 RepID=UPI0015F8AA76
MTPKQPPPAGASVSRRRRGGRRRRGPQGPSGAPEAPQRDDGPEATARRRALRARLDAVMLRDEHRLRRRIDGAPALAELAAVDDLITASQQRVERRRASAPAVSYPEALPVSARRDDVKKAIAENQVVIVAGETGSGKTTQLPKMCLELGLGVRGLIGHTQPRRIAARTVAERVAEELDRPLGDTVGYTVRFTDHVTDDTLIKVMTDGILLNEIQRDRMLRRYDVLIIDEAHERSLNIDFILGYLKQLLPRRPDLKVIITSATIDPERFAEHFAVDGAAAPIIEVSGRTFPVEMRYRPLTVERGTADAPMLVDRDPLEAIGAAVDELVAAGPGDILVFLAGEREIRDTADALRERRYRNTEILPLYSRLSAAEQHRVFTAHTGRRIVLSTNVAETSLTVPGIRYVVDPGTARISRYSVRTKVQRLPIEPISQASARQRAGRCGRVADGICIRLYSEDDFEARPAFTEPEILRTNLAAVILQMTALGLGDLAAFPFVEPPDPRAVRDGLTLLEELGAIVRGGQTGRGAQHRLTDTGRSLARLPVDPRMGRMLLEAQRTGCLRELLIIVSAISMQDVRERPADHQQDADARHARFAVKGSDFLARLRLWDYLREQRNALGSSAYRRMCKAEYLHFMRIREWQDLHGQLRQIAREMGWQANDAPASEDTIHQALLSGLLSHIGARDGDKRDYLGARGARFAIFPGSSLFKGQPRWVMAGELVETSRLWAREVARIEPEWVEKLAPDLVKHSYSEPHWSIKHAAPMAYEKVTLYGVPLIARRLAPYGRVDREASRDLFIRHALVQGEWRSDHAFLTHNRSLLEDALDLEDRARRRDIVVRDDDLFDFYDRRLPADIVSGRHFDSWWKKARRTDPALLDFTADTVTNDDADTVAGADYPDAWLQGGVRLELDYRFEPGHPEDGVTVRVPVELLPQVRTAGFDWLVPGMREELATTLIRSLPKQLRRAVVPAPDFAAAALARVQPRSEPLVNALARELSRLGSCRIAPEDFRSAALPDHLRVTFAAVDRRGRELGRSKDLTELRTRLARHISDTAVRDGQEHARPAATVWTSETLGDVPEQVTSEVAGQKVVGFPTLSVREPATPAGPAAVAVTVVSTRAEQSAAMRTGTRRLLLNAVPGVGKRLLSILSTADRLVAGQYPFGGLDGLVADVHECAVDEAMMRAGGPVRDPDAFERLKSAVGPAARAAEPAIVTAAVEIVRRRDELQVRLGEAAASTAVSESTVDDVRQQLADLVRPGFLLEAGSARAAQIPRYLRAATLRLESAPTSGPREHQGMDTLDRVYGALERYLAHCPPGSAESPAVQEVFWMIEELRVGLFAQKLGTARQVSEKRILRAIDTLPR